MHEADLGDQRADLKGLASQSRRRRLILAAAELLVLLGVLGLLGVQLATCGRDDMNCESAIRRGPPGVAVSVCQREYQETGSPDTGVLLAGVMLQVPDFDGAAAIANGLLASSRRSDAFHVLGQIAMRRGQLEEAATLLERARMMHVAEARPRELARDHQALAGVYSGRKQHAEALRALHECIAIAQVTRDNKTASFCHLSASHVLAEIGYLDLAEHELDRAERLATPNPIDPTRVQIELQRGSLRLESSRTPMRTVGNAQALQAFKVALVGATALQRPAYMLASELGIAYAAAETGDIDKAEQHLAAAREIDVKRENEPEELAIEARIAYARGNLSLAWSLNERAYPTASKGGDRIDIAVLQTRIALAQGDLVRAEEWAGNGIDDAEELRAEAVVELRPWILSTHREPYELMFVTLARAGRAEDALFAFDRWQGRTLRDSLARPSPLTSIDLRGVAIRVESLGTWLPVASSAPLVTDDHRAAAVVLPTLDLLALAVADGDVWALSAYHGKIGVRRLESYAALKDRFDNFKKQPTNLVLAEALGDLILDDQAFRPTGEVLHVLLDAPLAALPIVALFRKGRPLVAARPLLRVPRLPETVCVRASRSERATVLGDPSGDLPAARSEANDVAKALHTTALVGAKATSNALFAANHHATLHVAVHGVIDAGGGTLKLSDRSVSALQIAARRLGPSLVVLSACTAAASDDGELASSLASAFLASGSDQVVATLRPVSDAGTRDLMTRFYRAGGVTDPVRALARVQAELATAIASAASAGLTNDKPVWPNFAVFGHDVCPSDH